MSELDGDKALRVAVELKRLELEFGVEIYGNYSGDLIIADSESTDVKPWKVTSGYTNVSIEEVK